MQSDVRPEKKPVALWNPKMESLSRSELNRLKLWKLQRMVRFAYDHSSFYRRKYDAARVRPEDIRSLDDVQKLPFVWKAELQASQKACPLFGDYTAAEPERAMRYHQTSGTSGTVPLRILDSRKDWEWVSETWCYGMFGFGLRPEDVVVGAFGYGAFIGFWGAHYAAERIGCLTIPTGGGTSASRIRMIMDLGATAVIATPTYAIRLVQVALEMGINLARDSKVNILILAGEPGGNIPSTKECLEMGWGARAGDFPGMSESGGGFAYECSEQSGAIHLIEDHYLDEVIDPKTSEPMDYGEKGERVMTSFGRSIMPMIRYRTGDLVERVPASQCSCGRTFDLYQGGILGRADDMKIIRGVNVYPSAIENVVRQFEAIQEFQIVIWDQDGIPQITVKVDPGTPLAPESSQNLRETLSGVLKKQHGGLRFGVEVVEPGALPRFELKARRVLDQRKG